MHRMRTACLIEGSCHTHAMHPGETAHGPRIEPVPFLWGVLFVGCFTFGLSLAAMFMPVSSGAAPIARVGFGMLLVLVVVVIGLSAWQLTRALTAPRPAPRWVVVLPAVAAGTVVGAWAAATQSSDHSPIERIGTTFLSGLGFFAAVAVGVRARACARFPCGP